MTRHVFKDGHVLHFSILEMVNLVLSNTVVPIIGNFERAYVMINVDSNMKIHFEALLYYHNSTKWKGFYVI